MLLSFHELFKKELREEPQNKEREKRHVSAAKRAQDKMDSRDWKSNIMN